MKPLAAAFTSAAVAAMLWACPALADVPVTGDPVLYWTQVEIAGLAGEPASGARRFAIANVALHDAVNATLGSPDRAYLGNIATPGGDTRAAAAVAAHDVLVNVNPARTADFDAALAASLALVPNGAAKTNGMATGAAFAAAALASRATDGSSAVVTYPVGGAPGVWQPTPPGFVPGIDAAYATMTPWLMTSQSQFRPAPPPVLGSVEYAAAFNEVMAIGSATSATRTADQTFSAQFWAASPGDPIWMQAAIDAASTKGLSTLENARLVADLAMTLSDASIVAFDSKLFYDYWRPVTAIRMADLDGNPLTAADPNWNPLIVTPPFPSYASAHAIFAGAAASVLDDLLGDDINFCLTAAVGSRCWNSFDDAASDAAHSREWGGIHWSFDNAAGLAAGYEVGAFDLSRDAFSAAPEPSTWGLMILGMGALGALLRRRRRTLQRACLEHAMR